jgi:hypothetical protein
MAKIRILKFWLLKLKSRLILTYIMQRVTGGFSKIEETDMHRDVFASSCP